MQGHWLVVHPTGYRVRRDSLAPKGLLNRDQTPVVLGRRCTIAGGIHTRGSLFAEPGVRIRGDVLCAGRLVIGPRSRVEGDLWAGADLHLLPGACITGTVRAEADVHLHADVEVHRVQAGGDLIVRGPCRTGSLESGGRIVTRYQEQARNAQAALHTQNEAATGKPAPNLHQ